jgi:carbon monoxide dehydrogenase subunit G
MQKIEVAVEIAVDPAVVWTAAADLESHAEWMADARSVEVEGPVRRGVGTRLRVVTQLGPFRTLDLIEVTDWEEGSRIGVRHRGLVRGEGSFRLAPTPGGTRFTWTERLAFPWYLGGQVTAWLAAPMLRWVWRRNLRNLKQRLEASTTGTTSGSSN